MPRVDQSSTQKRLTSACDVYTERVKAAFVISDPVDWGRDIQVIFCVVGQLISLTKVV